MNVQYLGVLLNEKQNLHLLMKVTTTREWIMLIIILMIVEAFIAYAAFENSASPNALNFVSFTGTIISIILAMLAIGYTYGESISQKTGSSELARQIDSLSRITESIKIKTEPLEKIELISQQLVEVKQNFSLGISDIKSSTTSIMSDVLKAIGPHQVNSNDKLQYSTGSEEESHMKFITNDYSYNRIPFLWLATRSGEKFKDYNAVADKFFRFSVQYVRALDEKNSTPLTENEISSAIQWAATFGSLLSIMSILDLYEDEFYIKNDILEVSDGIYQAVVKSSGTMSFSGDNWLAKVEKVLTEELNSKKK